MFLFKSLLNFFKNPYITFSEKSFFLSPGNLGRGGREEERGEVEGGYSTAPR